MTELRTSTVGGPWDPTATIQAAREATRLVEPILRAAARGQAARTSSLVPKRTGALAGGVRGRVRRTRTGYVLTVGPGKGTVQVRTAESRTTNTKYGTFYARFVEEGTGARGPLGSKIAAGRRGLVPVAGGARVPSGIGQAPQHPFARARREYDSATARALDEQVQRILDQAVQRASR